MRKCFLWLILLLALPTGCTGALPTVTSPSATVDAAPASPAPADTDSANADPASATLPDALSADLGFPRTFVIDSAASEARYNVQEEFFGRAIELHAFTTESLGRTSEISGQFVLDVIDVDGDEQPRIVQGAVEVDLSTLASDRAERDRRVRTIYLETADFPLALFVPTEVADFAPSYALGNPTEFQLSGDMTIRDITKPATFNVTATLDDLALTGVATTTLLLSDYDIAPPRIVNFVTVEDELEVTVEFTARAEE